MAVQNCSAQEFIKLKRKNHLRLAADDYIVSVFSFKYSSLSAYLKAAEVSAYEILHGDQICENLYTEQDAFVLEFINLLNKNQQRCLYDVLRQIYPKDIFETLKGQRINHKIFSLFSLLPYGHVTRIAKRDATIPRFDKLTNDALTQVERISRGRNDDIVIPTDTIPSLASFLGISLHFMLDLEVPLYSKTQEGDLIFDYYTLLSPAQREVVLALAELHIDQVRRG